ncbi:MAG: rRNA ((527)-N(7))-methyltransferase [Microvirga sp.]|nr:rRNA ((527)-N(7))-methyltransferase [Microvirga sp.]
MTARLGELQDVAGPVSRETLDRLEAFERFFLKWSGRMNLVSASTLRDVWGRHILDSAQLVALAPHASKWLDIGSGGGFPGLIVAFLISERNGASVDLVESNIKKAAYLRAAIGEFRLPARVHPKRISDLRSVLAQPEIVTARAVAPLALLMDLAGHWLIGGARGFFHKGRDYRREVEETLNRWVFDLVEHPSRISPEGVVLELRNVRRLADKIENSGHIN